MANSTTDKTRPAQQEQVNMMSVVAPAVGWLIPGAGHMIQKRWIRGLLLFVSIATLFVLGLAMQARVYKANGGDILDILGFIGDVGAGALYIVTMAADWGQGAIRSCSDSRCRAASIRRTAATSSTFSALLATWARALFTS